jgi:glycerate 2-kinase
VIQFERLKTESMRKAPWGDSVARILETALRAASPAEAVRKALHREGNQLEIAMTTYDLSHYRQFYVTGCGKAGAPMAQAVVQILGSDFSDGIVIVKEGHIGSSPDVDTVPARMEVIEAGHPVPDQRGMLATQKVIQFVKNASEDDLIFCVISGGGSALLTAPAPGIPLKDLQKLTTLLLGCGANIQEINCLRKHLDEVKGGGLARMASPATMIGLILSDVIGSPLDVIASGPTVPDSTTYEQALSILGQYHIIDRAPKTILERLRKGERGEFDETPKPGDPLFENVQNVIVGSNVQSAEAAINQARLEGFNAMLLTTYLQGEARQAGMTMASIARQINANLQPLDRPACIITGGETTVTMTKSGKGGRNQEMALGAVEDMAGLKDVALVTLATDGGDGPTDAAGAVVTGDTYQAARLIGMEPRDFLDRHDAYPFFEALGDLIKTGPTLTNVNDLAFLFAF